MNEEEILRALRKKLRMGGRDFGEVDREFVLSQPHAIYCLEEQNPEECVEHINELATSVRAYNQSKEQWSNEGVAPASRRTQRTVAPKSQPDDTVAGALTPEERERSEITAIALANLASNMPEVQAFREVFLGKRVLTDSEAHDFIDSPVLRYEQFQNLEELGIPVIGHTSVLTQWPRSATAIETAEDGSKVVIGKQEGVTISVDPPGIEYDVFSPVLPTNSLAGPQWRLTIMLPERRSGVPRPVKCWKGSALGELKWLANLLAKRFMWSEADAGWFVLTGTPPRVPAISTSFQARNGFAFDFTVDDKVAPNALVFQRAQITLKIDPWVSPATVARVYAQRQKEVIGKQRNGRPLTNQLSVYRFVEETRRRLGQKPTWQKLAQLWEEEGRTPVYKRPDNMSRAFVKATSSLLFPYGWGEKREDT